ncbi:hypothetical protein ACOME3_005953 [Neoechinorhynchus agilis]
MASAGVQVKNTESHKQNDSSKRTQVTIFCGTFNVNCYFPSDRTQATKNHLIDWFSGNHTKDVALFAIALQELETSEPDSQVLKENERIAWYNNLILDAINNINPRICSK